MLRNGIIEPNQSKWARQCVLLENPDESMRFCTYYRKLNMLTKTYSHPISTMDNRIEKLVRLNICDLLKYYWTLQLTERPKQILDSVIPVSVYFQVL